MPDRSAYTFEGMARVLEEDAQVYEIVANKLGLSGTVIEVGQGKNQYPQKGLLAGGAAEIVGIAPGFERSCASGPAVMGITHIESDDDGVEYVGPSFAERIKVFCSSRWGGVDAGGFRPWVKKRESVGAVVFNRVLDFVAAHSKPHLLDPVSWINVRDFFGEHPFQRWSRIRRAFKHAWNALEPGGWMIISDKYRYLSGRRALTSRVLSRAREKLPELLERQGFVRIQIIDKPVDDDGRRGLLFIVAQKPGN